MTVPEPHPGLVVSYAYLWADESERGLEEGRKDRPFTIVVARRPAMGRTSVIVVPMTHAPPLDPEATVEVPRAVKGHLGLDDHPSWVVVSEINEFFWPGPDLRPILPGRFMYGVLPPTFFRRIRDRLLATHARGVLARVQRSE